MPLTHRNPSRRELSILLQAEFASSFSGDAFKVQVAPIVGARNRWCTENAQRLVAAEGGAIVDCFDITVIGDRFLEVEAHVIVQRRDGSHVDPSPHLFGFDEVYVIRAKAPFDERLPPNRIVAITEDTHDVQYARYLSAAHEIYSAYGSPGQEICISDQDVQHLARDYRITRWQAADESILAAMTWHLFASRVQ